MEKKFIPAKKYFAIRTVTTLNEIQKVAMKETDHLKDQIKKMDLEVVGPMEFIYFDCTEDKNKEFTLEIALPIKEVKGEIPSGYSLVLHEPFNCIVHEHKGDVSDLFSVYDKIFSEMWNNSLRPTNQVREVYKKYFDPFSEDNITEIQVGLQ